MKLAILGVVVAFVGSGYGLATVLAQAPPQQQAPPPSCEDRLSVTAAYAERVVNARNRLEEELAGAVARIRTLEAEKAKAAEGEKKSETAGGEKKGPARGGEKK